MLSKVGDELRSAQAAKERTESENRLGESSQREVYEKVEEARKEIERMCKSDIDYLMMKEKNQRNVIDSLEKRIAEQQESSSAFEQNIKDKDCSYYKTIDFKIKERIEKERDGISESQARMKEELSKDSE